MKIIDFQPGAYRNLPPRAIHFTRQVETAPQEENGCSIRFLVGKNGTGKTNILRFLASIFIAIEEDYRRPRPNSPAYTVPYRLVYELHGTRIEINSTGKGRNGVTFTINGKPENPGDIPSRDQILPANVLVYTSGDYRDWQSLFRPGDLESDEEQADTDWNALRREEEYPPNRLKWRDETNSTEKDLQPLEANSGDESSDESEPQGDSSPSYRRVILASTSQLKFALLAALLDHQFHNRETSALHDALVEVNLRLLAFSLQVHLNNTVHPYREQLNSLFQLTSRTIQHWENQLWVYDLGEIDIQSGATKLQQLAEKQPPFNFYQMLCNLEEQGILLNANLVIEYTPDSRTGQPRRVLLADDLSDGEFAFISRMALIYLLNEKECLFLLDEPEVHFNDDWKRNLVDSIERALTQPEKTDSEVILTTHASIVLTDAFSDEVILMTYAGQQIPPRTLGGEPGELLQSVLGASQTVGKRAIRKIQKALETKDRATLEAMLKQVGPGLYRFTIIEELQDVSPPEKD